MQRKATLILMMALALTLTAGTVAIGAPKEKRRPAITPYTTPVLFRRLLGSGLLRSGPYYGVEEEYA